MERTNTGLTIDMCVAHAQNLRPTPHLKTNSVHDPHHLTFLDTSDNHAGHPTSAPNMLSPPGRLPSQSLVLTESAAGNAFGDGAATMAYSEANRALSQSHPVLLWRCYEPAHIKTVHNHDVLSPRWRRGIPCMQMTRDVSMTKTCWYSSTLLNGVPSGPSPIPFFAPGPDGQGAVDMYVDRWELERWEPAAGEYVRGVASAREDEVARCERMTRRERDKADGSNKTAGEAKQIRAGGRTNKEMTNEE
ncbi:hypothetical protein Hypma_005821 [Hypsizygus marmoreus]|uniref:Uncharacterized protein n=1 Tax=Hypsizygus marmoreus TaxID=39966 RepID=A0A369KA77_HYPMA|nr:hypothetical protein Hypma_005821 [Hypsizygus marmoreus]